MRVLVDTHAFLWFLSNDARLSAAARHVVSSGANEVMLSIASLWEAAIKVRLGKLTLAEPLHVLLPRELNRNRINVLPIGLPHVIAVSALPMPHRDPFDRMLVAQCQVEGLPLVSADAIFDQYGVQRIW